MYYNMHENNNIKQIQSIKFNFLTKKYFCYKYLDKYIYFNIHYVKIDFNINVLNFKKLI